MGRALESLVWQRYTGRTLMHARLLGCGRGRHLRMYFLLMTPSSIFVLTQSIPGSEGSDHITKRGHRVSKSPPKKCFVLQWSLLGFYYELRGDGKRRF